MVRAESSPPQPVMSGRGILNGALTELVFTSDGMLRWTGAKQRWLAVEKEVLGFEIEGAKIRIKAVVAETDGICCFGSSGDLVRKDFVFEPLPEGSQKLWCQHLRDYLDSLGRPRRLFIFVNPYGGKRAASKIFVDVVKPLLEDAAVQFTLQETTHRLHAKEVASTLNLEKYDGIVCVSGDGILVEVVNGLLGRPDWSTAIKTPLGIIPGGTSNGMVKSTLDSVGEPCKASNAVLAIIQGHKCSLDVATISQGDTKFFSILMLAWGLVADIDIESEKYRWMGSARIDFYALQRIFHVRKYNGRVSFVPAPGFEAFGEPYDYNGQATGAEQVDDPSKEQTIQIQDGYQGPNINLADQDWRTITGPFVSVWLHNVPWGGETVMAAPDAKFSDGYLDLILMKECTTLSLLAFLTELSNGGHVKSPAVMYIKVKAFILEPGQRRDDPTKGGIIDVDGEVLARGNKTYMCDQKALMTYDDKLQITVDQGLATIFCPR